MSFLFMLAHVAFAQDSGSASAGYLDNNLYQPPVETDGMLWTEDAGIAPEGVSHATVQSNFVFDPLTETDPDNDFESRAQALRTDLILGYATRGFQVAVDVPTYAVNDSSPLDSESEFGLGDLGIDAKLGIVEFGEDNAGNIGFGARLILPTTSEDIFEAGTDDAVAWEARVVADGEFADRLKLAGNIGTRGLPDEVVDTDGFNNQFFFRAGAGVDIIEDVGLSLEVAGAFDYDTPIDDQRAPVQGMFGAYGRVAGDLVLRGGLGSGWIPGTEGPQHRLLFAVSWDPGAARENGARELGERSATRERDEEREDARGPEREGWREERDERREAWRSSRPVSVRVRDAGGRLVHDAEVRIDRDGQTIYTGDEAVDTRLEPGAYTLTAQSPGYTPLKTEFQVFPGDNVQISAVLTGSTRLDPNPPQILDEAMPELPAPRPEPMPEAPEP